jgi:hypothetical protein
MREVPTHKVSSVMLAEAEISKQDFKSREKPRIM